MHRVWKVSEVCETDVLWLWENISWHIGLVNTSVSLFLIKTSIHGCIVTYLLIYCKLRNAWTSKLTKYFFFFVKQNYVPAALPFKPPYGLKLNEKNKKRKENCIGEWIRDIKSKTIILIICMHIIKSKINISTIQIFETPEEEKII